jgi:hypothetical protein
MMENLVIILRDAMSSNNPIKNGIGDGDDLLVNIHGWTKMYECAMRDFWTPHIHTGWYYLGSAEKYLFSNKEEVQFSWTGYEDITYVSTDPLDIPSQTGPVICEGDNYNWTRSTTNLAAWRVFTPVVETGEYLSISIPNEPIEVTAEWGNLRSVPSLDFLVERDLYYWNGSKIWIKRDLDDVDRAESIWVTYSKDQVSLLQEEVHIVDSDGLIRVQHGRVAMGSLVGSSPVGEDPRYYPRIVVPGIIDTSPLSVYDNVITPSGSIDPGTRVAVRYYVEGSFCVSGTSSGSFMGYQQESDNLNICYENGKGHKWNVSDINLNPTTNGVGDGFIYISEDIHPAEGFTSIDLDIAPLRVFYDLGMPIRLRASARDFNGSLLPNLSLVVLVTDPNGSTTTPTSTGNSTTDYLGARHFVYFPEESGTYTVMASGTSSDGSTITSSGSFISELSYIETGLSTQPQVIMFIQPSLDSDGFKNIYLYLCGQDGSPYLDQISITVTCETGKLFQSRGFQTAGDSEGKSTIVVEFDDSNPNTPLRLTSCRYKFNNTEDTIVAYPTDSGLAAQFKSSPLRIDTRGMVV